MGVRLTRRQCLLRQPGGLVAQAAGGGGDRGAMALQLALQMIDVLETLNQEIDQAAHSCGQV